MKSIPQLGFGTWNHPEDETYKIVRDALDIGFGIFFSHSSADRRFIRAGSAGKQRQGKQDRQDTNEHDLQEKPL